LANVSRSILKNGLVFLRHAAVREKMIAIIKFSIVVTSAQVDTLSTENDPLSKQKKKKISSGSSTCNDLCYYFPHRIYT